MTLTLNPYQASMNPAAYGLNSLPDGGLAPSEVDPGGTQVIHQRSFLGMPLSFWVGAFVLLCVLKWVSEHPDTSLEPAHIHVGGYNLITLVTAWIVGWGLLKLIVNRWFGHTATASFVNFL